VEEGKRRWFGDTIESVVKERSPTKMNGRGARIRGGKNTGKTKTPKDGRISLQIDVVNKRDTKLLGDLRRGKKYISCGGSEGIRSPIGTGYRERIPYRKKSAAEKKKKRVSGKSKKLKW